MKTPALVVVCGPPCGGKSAIASRLAAELKVTHLEMDAIRLRLLPESQQEEAHRDIAYRAMHHTAELFLRAQKAVVLDATYTRAPQRRELRNLADRVGANVYLIQCSASPEVAVARLQTREPGKHAAVDLTPEGVSAAALRFSYADGALLLRTDTQGLDACLAAATSYLESSEPFARWTWIAYGPETSLAATPEVSADAVYQEWYNELRRYRDYEHGIVVWASTILLACAGGLVAVIASDNAPRLTTWQAVLASALMLLFGAVSGWIAEYVGKRYRELRKEASVLQPRWKQQLDERYAAPPHPIKNPLKAQVLLLFVLWSLATALLVFLVGAPEPHNKQMQRTRPAQATEPRR